MFVQEGKGVILVTSGYEKLLRHIKGSQKTVFILKLYGYLATVMCVLVFIYLFLAFYEISIAALVGLLVTLGVPFLSVSLVRRLIDSPRPYEIYDIYDIPPKKKKGSSFPSRHAFSIFAIGTLCLFVHPLIGAATLVLGIIMCVSRVLLGIHFIRDVVAGALIGVISSLIGAFILIY